MKKYITVQTKKETHSRLNVLKYEKGFYCLDDVISYLLDKVEKVG